MIQSLFTLAKLKTITLAIVILMSTTSLVFSQPVSTEDRPNILFIIADDLGWKDVGFNGSQFYQSPNLDKLASQGMFFTNAYANAPLCTPSRAAIFSGQYAPRTKVYTVGSSARGESAWRVLVPPLNHNRLDPEKITIAEALKTAGYTNGFIGKYHLGATKDANGPLEQGFDKNVAGCYNGKPASYFSPYRHEILPDGPKGEYLTDRLTNEAISFIEDNKEGPFFLTLAYHSPHTPIQAKDEIASRYISKIPSNGQFDPIYAAMIESLDWNIGRIMDRLDHLGITENTVVVFFSDNGGLHAVTSMKPLKGFKGTLDEGGIRVPMLARWPGKIAPATVCHEPVIGTDIYPSFLELAGVEKPKEYPLDGESLILLFLQKGQLKRPAIFWHFPVYLTGSYGMTRLWRTTPVGAIRMGNYKLLEYFEDGHLELYNLRDDIGETNDLATMEPGKAKHMQEVLAEWRRNINAPFPLKKNPEYDSSKKPHRLPKKISRERIYTSNEK